MRHLFAFAVFASLLPFATAQAQSVIQSQEGIALENQILQLQQQVQAQPSSNGSSIGSDAAPSSAAGGSTADSSVMTNLLNQVGQLQAQVQQLSGQVDTLQNQVNTQHDATEKEIGDLKFQASGGAAAAATPGAPAPAPAPAPALAAAGAAVPPPPVPASAAAVPASPKAALRAGQAAFAKRDYHAAEASARGILSAAKSSPEGYQAQFLLAQSLAGQGRPQDAAIAYDDAYNRSRTGSNAPGSLLGLANSLTAIHQDAAACDTLASLNSQFPTPPSVLKSSIVAAGHRAHCS